jgi:SsrA-binding protein
MSIKVIVTNRKARHEYHILEKFEGGIVLNGSEVKALREGKGNIKEAYIRFVKTELYVIGMHIGKYSNAGYTSHTPVHDRKLLLHKKELQKIQRMVEEKGKTLIPISMYFKGGYVKVEFGLAKGKKLWDKRKNKMEKDVSRQIDMELKRALN